MDVSKFAKVEYKPKLAYIIVSKRISSRFFDVHGGAPANPAPGFVVDHTVTLHERFDFFLVSQSVTQGTVSPTSFNVVEDDTGLSPNVHQRLAYILTHLYYNWPVSYQPDSVYLHLVTRKVLRDSVVLSGS